MNVQRFHAGETAEATVEFIHGDRVGQVTATFVHSDDPTTKLLLSGEPEEQVASGGAGYTYWRVTLSGEVTTEHALGAYQLDSPAAANPGGAGGQLAAGGAGYAYWRVTLSGEVTTEKELGECQLDSLEAEYHGGRRVPFG